MTTLPVREYIDRLDALFGVRDPVDRERLFELHRRGQLEQLAAAIANELTLPVGIRLTVTSERARFHSHHLARTDGRGRGVEAIEAQVIIPTDLPLFGSAALRAYPITVLIMPTFADADPATGVTILAHELSHVLLYALRYPDRENEVFTDLLPLVFGFSDVVRHGRKVSTSTFGYLSDSDFTAALDRVDSLLADRNNRKHQLKAQIIALEAAIGRVAADLAQFSDLRQHLDTRPGRIHGRDAARLVAIHAPDYIGEIERALRQAREVAMNADSFLGTLSRYPREVVGQLDTHSLLCSSVASRVDGARLTLRRDITLIARHCSVSRRFLAGLARLINHRIRRSS